MSAEAIVRQKMSEDGWLESSNKPGLFYRKYKERGYTIYIDLRNNQEKYYGFTKDNDKVDQQIIDECTTKIRKILPAIGCAQIEDFEQESTDKPSVAACVKCSSTLYIKCVHCDKNICTKCGSEVK